ncbi:MAG: phosphate ABC transporter substrate-binding protein [Chloroflexi bacterium]|nr:MAG: phosphate ABC transporter substrate-binding protein [Chloroflexota bacterium]
MHTQFSRFVVLLLLPLALIGCGGPAEGSTTNQAAQTIENKGSDTLLQVAQLWAETYMKKHPEVRISVNGGGSGTGIAALINGTVDIANASREMKPKEIERAKERGINPVQHVVARDALAVVVNPQNPVNQLTFQQIADIFTGKITNWKEVGGEDRPIVLLSRESNSGTYVFFLENVVQVGAGDPEALFSPDTLLLLSSEVISREIEQNPNTIGYDGLGYVTPKQKTIAVAEAPGKPFVKPSIETVNQGLYPIARPLYMYTNGEPTGVIKAYLDWILSDEGQTLVREVGFVPLQ